MGFCFQLEIPLPGVGAVIFFKRTLDVDGMGVVALDQIAVITVHRADEPGERGDQTPGQTSVQAGRFSGEFEREVGQVAAAAVMLRDPKRL